MANRSTAAVGVILAGGRGKRFGGIDKSFLVLAGQPLIVHVVGRIDGQVSRLVVNTNSTDVRYRELGAALCPDAPISKPATGPLVGLASVFAEIAAGGGASSYVLSVSVDTPFLPFEHGSRMLFAKPGHGWLLPPAADAIIRRSPSGIGAPATTCVGCSTSSRRSACAG
jgi:molybdenum cofactor guanylyltransferase